MSMISRSDTPLLAAPPRARTTILGWATTGLVMTALAAGCGFVLANVVDQNFLPPTAPVETGAPKPPALDPDYTGNAFTVAAKPMVTNLGDPKGTWIRLEGTFVMTGLEILAAERLATEVQQDMLGYLHSTTLAQLEGASGLLHLREDLNDIAKAHSGGHVSRFLLETMVVQ